MLALKLFLVPSLIWLITIAGRRWGPGVAGWLSGFPVVSAPVLFFFSIEHGALFAAEAAAATLSAVFAVFVFSLAYCWTAVRNPWPLCLSAGLAAYFAVVSVLYRFAPPVWMSAPLIVVMVASAPRLFPPSASSGRAPAASSGEIVLRVSAGALLVVTLTYFAQTLGARLGGLFAMFPVLGTVLAVFSHRHAGANFTINLLRGMAVGYYAFSSFCLVLAVALPRVSIAAAFTLGLAVAAVIQAFARRLVHGHPPAVAGETVD